MIIELQASVVGDHIGSNAKNFWQQIHESFCPNHLTDALNGMVCMDTTPSFALRTIIFYRLRNKKIDWFATDSLII